MSRFDVVVIGGGPAGMMAAARAAQYGARTALIEKNRELGRKLMITGRGRCNFAHDEEDPQILARSYRRGGDFLLPSLRKFGTKETLAFFLRRGVVAAHERGRRIYPKEGMDASSVLNALWTALKDGNVHLLRGAQVKALDFFGGKARRVITDRQEIEAGAFIVATGGLSFPRTGSTGDGYRWARKAGHQPEPAEPALCPVKIAERFDSSLSGLKLKNVRVTLMQDGSAVDERFGEMDFTPFGISGAIIMDMASRIADCLKRSSDVSLHVDLKPALDPQRLDARIDRDFAQFSDDALRFALRKLLPGELIPEVIKKARLDMGKPCGQTTPDERADLRDTLKDFKVTPTGLLGFQHAIITSGGVKTDELNPETMASKFIQNLYFAGEIIDIDGPTGGFNLQECWSTGYAAGSAAAESLGFTAPTEEQIVRQMVNAHARRMELSARKDSRHPENAKEGTEEMTIKTGPADDPQSCGWRGSVKDSESEPRSQGKRPDGTERPDRPRDERFDRPDRTERPYRPRDERFGRSDRTERPYRPRDERFDRAERTERPYRPRDERFDRAERTERPYRPRDERFQRPDRTERPYRPRDERFDRPDRTERPYRPRDDRFDRHDGTERPYRPRDERFGRHDGTERPYRPRDERFGRSDRTERPYRPRDERFDRPDRTERPYRPRDERFDRAERTERPYRPRDERFDRPDGTDRPYQPRDERFDRSDRTERPYRPRDERFGRAERTERPYRPRDTEKGDVSDRRRERPHGDSTLRGKKPFRRFADFEHFREDKS